MFVAVYFDTNVFEKLESLETVMTSKLWAITSEFGVPLLLPEVVFRELLQHRQEAHRKVMARLHDGLDKLKKLGLLVSPPTTATAADVDIATKKALEAELQSVGLTIVPTPDLDFRVLLDKAIKKSLPFRAGGKGFKDTVILETIISDCGRFDSGQVLFVSANEKDLPQSLLSSRGKDVGAQLQLCLNLVAAGEAVEKALEKAKWDFLRDLHERLLSFVRSETTRIQEFVRENWKPMAMTLEGFGTDDERFKLDFLHSVSITRLLGFEPGEIVGTFISPPLGKEVEGRLYFNTFVAVKADVEVTISKASSPLGRKFDSTTGLPEPDWWRRDESTETWSIDRQANVHCSVTEVGDEYQDLRLHSCF